MYIIASCETDGGCSVYYHKNAVIRGRKVYIDEKNGDDSNPGVEPECPVKTFDAAINIAHGIYYKGQKSYMVF